MQIYSQIQININNNLKLIKNYKEEQHMKSYILAGVGTVTGFDGNALLFNAKTLTESSASLSVTAEATDVLTY